MLEWLTVLTGFILHALRIRFTQMALLNLAPVVKLTQDYVPPPHESLA